MKKILVLFGLTLATVTLSAQERKDSKVRLKNKIACLLSYFGVDFLIKIINNNRA